MSVGAKQARHFKHKQHLETPNLPASKLGASRDPVIMEGSRLLFPTDRWTVCAQIEFGFNCIVAFIIYLLHGVCLQVYGGKCVPVLTAVLFFYSPLFSFRSSLMFSFYSHLLFSTPLLSSPFSPILSSSPVIYFPLFSSLFLSCPIFSSPLLSSPLLISSPLLSFLHQSSPLLSLRSSPVLSSPVPSFLLLTPPLHSPSLLSFFLQTSIHPTYLYSPIVIHFLSLFLFL